MLVRTRVAGRWGFEVEARDAAFFHFVTESHAYVRRSGDKTIELLPGDLVLLPRGTAHEVSHSVHGKTVSLQHFLASHAYRNKTGTLSQAPFNRHPPTRMQVSRDHALITRLELDDLAAVIVADPERHRCGGIVDRHAPDIGRFRQ